MLQILRKRMKIIMLIVAILFAATMFYGLGYRGFRMATGRKDLGIATVNGQKIDEVRFNQTLSRILRSFPGRVKPSDIMLAQYLALREMVNFTLMRAEAEKKVKVRGEEVERSIEEMMKKENIPSKAVLEAQLKKMGYKLSTFKRMIKEEILIAKIMNLVKSGVTLTAEDLKEVLKKESQSGKKLEDLRAAALEEKQKKALLAWLQELSSKAKIEIGNRPLKAYDLRFQGRISEAISEYQQAIIENHGNAYLHLALGETYQEIGKLELAMIEYQKAISLNTADPDLYLALGKAYEKNKQIKLAIEQYKKASVLAGENLSLHEEVLDLFKRLGITSEVNREKAEIARIKKKQVFEEKLREEMEKRR